MKIKNIRKTDKLDINIIGTINIIIFRWLPKIHSCIRRISGRYKYIHNEEHFGTDNDKIKSKNEKCRIYF